MSAGGLEAATEFLKAAPADSGMAFVIVQHLEPNRKSALAEILGKDTEMPVVDVADGMRVEPDHVYVIIPAKTLLIENGVLRLTDPTEPRGRRHPIDRFFTSLAKDRKTKAIAVVLSGAGSNGTAGIQDIKLAGGLCVAQDPETAKFDSMPHYAIASGAVDYVLAPGDMPEALLKYARHPYMDGEDRPEAVSKGSRADMGDVLTLLRARAGHDFRQYKRSTLTRRTHRRMGLAGVERLDDYVDRLRRDPAELTQLAKDMMINVTGFFRDPEAWDALDREVIAPLVTKADPDQAVRVWVPACSTGEEGYTIAMLVAERMETAGKNLGVKVFATDLAANNLAAARKGLYPGSMVESLSPERLERFFDKEGDSYRVKPDIRETVLFASQNMLTDPPYSRMDLVSCRNLLIYLEPEAQERVLSLAHFALREGGYLFLGNAESVGKREHLFKTVSKRWRIYRRIGAARPAAVDFPTWPALERPEKRQPPKEIANVAVKSLAERFAPATVVIDRGFRIHHFHGPTDDFLAQPRGTPTHDLLALAREGLRMPIRRTVQQAVESGEPATLAVRRGAPAGVVEVTACPLDGDCEGLILVSFAREKGAQPPSAAPAKRQRKRASESELEDELKGARDELQATAEQYETANEELKAANEEVTSVNEELQATNEELEASKEELQSLNEELNAVNAQLERKVAELEESRDDLRNLLSGNEIATIFLDTRLRVKWFTPAVKTLFDLIDEDVGRPIDNFAQKFTDGNLVAKARAAIERLEVTDDEVRAESGKCFSLRVQPYRTRDNRIAGAVASFIDVTDLKATQAGIAAARDYAEAIVRTVRDPLLVLTRDLEVVSANPAFYKMFEMRPAEAEGKNVFEIRNGQWSTPRLQELLLELVPTHGEINDFEVEHAFPTLGKRIILNNARLIPGGGDQPDLILIAKEDVTERKDTERHREMLVAELSHRVKNTLAVVQSIATQTLRRSRSLDEFGEAFTGRIQALARAHDLAVAEDAFEGVGLAAAVRQALKPFRLSGQIVFGDGPSVDLSRQASQSLTLILHELATNAVKYGALSTPKGKVALDWRLEADGEAPRIAIEWTESGGPPVEPPTRRGHGTSFVQRGISYDLHGEAKIDYRPEGVRVAIRFPLAAVAPPELAQPRKIRHGPAERKL